MNIWIAEIGEPLPFEENARLHRYGLYSRWLAEKGHAVTWWTSSFSHSRKKNLVGTDRTIDCSGVRMKIIHGPGYSRNVSLDRINHQRCFAAKFHQQATEAFDREERPDLILAPIPTIEGASACSRLGSENHVPVVADIRDVWPDEIRDLAPPLLRPIASILLWPSYRRMHRVCSHAWALTAVSQTYLEYGLSQARRPRKPLDFVFPLSYSRPDISADRLAAARAWVAGLQIPTDAFVVCFFGTIGNFFDLDTVIAVARELGTSFYFILGGAGSSLENYRAQAAGMSNVLLPGWLDGAQIQAIMETSNAGLAPYSRDAKMSLPNKPFEYMSAGLPVVSSIQRELKDVLSRSGAGFTYQADSSAELIRILRRLASDRDLAQDCGRRAKELFEREFSAETVFARATERLAHIRADYAKNGP